MMRAALCVAVFLLQVACSTPGTDRPALGKAELLSPGKSVAGASALPPISAEQAFHLDADTRAFLDALLARRDPPGRRLVRLVGAMTEDGLLSLDYDELSTQTVSDTFRSRQGNCLSFTMLFVTLARELGLKVTYQVVRAPPTWTNDKGLVVIGNHVNALVENADGRDYVVDFNVVGSANRYAARAVSDKHILALFYANRGAEAILDKDYDIAFRYLQAAISTDGEVAGGWTNLGAMYARQFRYEHAEAAYLHALENDPGNRTALSNLANLYAETGREALAEQYRERVRRYQERNPYYHYSLAQGAYAEQRFEDALRALGSAIRLQDDPEFHTLQSQVYRAIEAQQSPVRTGAALGSGEGRLE